MEERSTGLAGLTGLDALESHQLAGPALARLMEFRSLMKIPRSTRNVKDTPPPDQLGA